MQDMIVFLKMTNILIMIKEIQKSNMFLRNYFLLKGRSLKIIKNLHPHKKEEWSAEDGP